MIYTLTILDLARIAYEASRKLTEALGGRPGVAWEQLPSSERDRAMLVMQHYHSVHAVKMSSDPYVALWQGVYAALYEYVPPATQQDVLKAQADIKAHGIGTSDNRAADNVPFEFVSNAVLQAAWNNNDAAAEPIKGDDFHGGGGSFGGAGATSHYEPSEPSHSHSSHDYSNDHSSGSSYDSGSDSSSSSSYDSGSSSSSD